MSNEIQHIVNIPLSKIEPRKENQYPLTDIVRLKESIRKNGVLQAVIFKRTGDTYTLIAGERRYTATRELYQDAFEAQDGDEMRRFVEIPAIVFDDIDNQTDEEIYRATDRNSVRRLVMKTAIRLEDVPEKVKNLEELLKHNGYTDSSIHVISFSVIALSRFMAEQGLELYSVDDSMHFADKFSESKNHAHHSAVLFRSHIRRFND